MLEKGEMGCGICALAVVVLYKTTPEQSKVLASLRPSIMADPGGRFDLSVLIYDNSPFPNELRGYRVNRVTYFHDPTNSGLSKAYNMGANLAREKAANWLLLLDQDTTLDADLIPKYWEAVQEFPDEGLFVPIVRTLHGRILSPFGYTLHRPFALRRIKPGLQSFRNKGVINSGIMVRRRDFEAVGGYDERIRLDFSDFEFIERIKVIRRNFVVVPTNALQDFSGETHSQVDAALARFRLYCEGARVFAVRSPVLIAAQCVLRALRLSLRYRSSGFISICLSDLFGGGGLNEE